MLPCMPTDTQTAALPWQDATAQAAAIRAGEVSATELLELYLTRIEAHDPVLRAYVTVDAEGARRAAAAADARTARSAPDELPPFHGVTISVKDVIDVAALPTTHSCKVLVDNVASDDDPLVERFRAAGFVVLGKTNVPEFCTSMTSSELNGICRNPWDRTRTPGGSSGGAAAALAAGMCAVAHGTDGAGSVRSPASFCGLVGVKPTRGLVDFGPERGNPYYGTSVDGVLTRSVRDATAMLEVFQGRPERAFVTDRSRPRDLRVAVATDAPFGTTTAECAEAATRTAGVLADLGHEVEEAAPEWATILATAAGPMSVPGAAALISLDEIDGVEPRNRPMVRSLAGLTVVEHARWVDQVRAAASEFLRFWDTYDVLVTPTAGIVAPSVSWAPWDQSPDDHMATFMSFPNFAQPFNLSGQPAMNVPTVWSTGGLPIGVHLAGRRGDDTLLLQVAAQLETAMPWADRHPPGLE
jgi:amidase